MSPMGVTQTGGRGDNLLGLLLYAYLPFLVSSWQKSDDAIHDL